MRIESIPASALRKGQLVMLQGRPCCITDMTSSKMMSETSGRSPAPGASYWCDGGCRQCIGSTRYHCLDCADYDLCEKCELIAAPLHVTGNHVFAKLH